MADDILPDSAPSGPRCPWCSAELASASETACPSCGATLVGDTDTSLPGVTALDAEAIIRNSRNATPQRRSRLLSWISGEYDAGGEEPAPPGSLEPPPPDVRREMLRLEIEAEVANLQAEAESIVAEHEVEALEEGLEYTAEEPAESGPTDGTPTGAELAPGETGDTGDVDLRDEEPTRP